MAGRCYYPSQSERTERLKYCCPTPAAFVPAYANYYFSGAEQILSETSLGTAITYDSTYTEKNITHSGALINVPAGTYSVTFRGQIRNDSTDPTDNVYFYFAVNGTKITDSGTTIDVDIYKTTPITLNYIITMPYPGTISVFGSSNSGLTKLKGYTTGPVHFPAAILTIHKISA